MRKIKEYYITIVVIAMVIVVNIGAFSSYLSSIKSNLSEQTNSHVDDIMDEAVECINLKLEEQANTLDTLALFVSSLDKQANNSEILKQALMEQKKKSGYSVLEVVTKEGMGTQTDTDYSDKSYFKNAIEGNTTMKEITDEEGVSVEAIAFAAPVFDDKGDICKVLIAKMEIETFSETIDISSFNQNGKAFVVKKDGTLLSKSKGLSSATTINDVFPEKKYEEQLLSSMRSRKSGIITYEGNDTVRYIGYSKLSFNKWYVVCIISSSVVEAHAGDMETDVILLGVEMAVILMVLVIYLIYIIMKIKKKGQINLERYFLATKYADTIMFDYSIAKNSMYINEKWEEMFGYKLRTTNVKDIVKETVFEEDLKEYEEKLELLTKEAKEVSVNVRILDSKKNPVKCCVKLFPICEKKAKLTKVIGFIEKNI